ncbi:MAG: hypothetical protein KAS17_05170 [Victivallaceae bacterium]|nr:hypothetical protein [Victivallaceae bacterium]
MLDNKKFKKQVDIVILLLMFWAVMCTAMFFYYAVIAKNKYIKLGNKLARRELSYYPERSKILDKNGIVLAWSEKYYDLYYNNLTDSPGQAKLIYKRVKKLLPETREPGLETVHSIMFRALQPKQILALEKLIYLFPELQITPRNERKVVSYPGIKSQIGQVRFISGRLVGINGFEKLYNKVLNGTPGKYRIMLDRNKNWIKNSGQSIRMAVPGKDVQLELTLEEICKRRQQ